MTTVTPTAQAKIRQASALDVAVEMTLDGAKPDITGWTFRATFGRTTTQEIVTWTNSDFTTDTSDSDYVLVTLAIDDTDLVTDPRDDYILQLFADDGTEETVLISIGVELQITLGAS